MKRLSGFTLIELLVVIAIIGVLVGLLLPAVQAARESGRRAACSNNLKQIGLALHNYHDAKKAFPSGGFGTVEAAGFGWSQWVELLPFMEYSDIYDGFDFNTIDFGAAPNVWVSQGAKLPVLRCASSQLPVLGIPSTGIPVPHYFGIAGANTFGRFTSTDQLQTETNGWGITSTRGMIPNCRKAGVVSPLGVDLRMCTDGTSKTLIVGEISAGIASAAGTAKEDRRPGVTMGWSMAGTGYAWTVNTGHMNSVTIRYPPNAAVEGQDGVGPNPWHPLQYANCPLASEHPGGTQAMTTDGATRFITNGIDMEVLTLLAVRDDGLAFTE